MDDDAPGTDRGETLLELVVTIAITGIAILVLIGGLGTSVRISGIHRQQAVAGAYLRTFAEKVQAAVAASPSAYAECGSRAWYTTATAFKPDDRIHYTAAVTAVRYWNGSVFDTACTAGSDTGIQEISLQVDTADHAVSEALDLIVRKPCRPGDVTCG